MPNYKVIILLLATGGLLRIKDRILLIFDVFLQRIRDSN